MVRKLTTILSKCEEHPWKKAKKMPREWHENAKEMSRKRKEL